MKLLITGDLVVNRAYNVTTQIEHSLIQLFAKSDYNIVNLEAPVTDCNSKIFKTGPFLKAHAKGTLNILKGLNVNLCTLANNHILDYGEQGVLDTLSFCKRNNINFVGAGNTKKEASKIFYIENKTERIAVINIAENEWSSATITSAGARGMHLVEDVQAIQEAKRQCDFVFVIVHGGHEYYNLPSPRMQMQYRFYVDNGADMVVGHHTHCISGKENYKGKPIYYSLGNFLFLKSSKFEDWYKGMVLEVEISKTRTINTKEIFIKQTLTDCQLSLIKSYELEIIKDRFRDYSSIILDKKKLEYCWNNYVLEKFRTYDNYWSPISFIKNKYIKIILSKMGCNGANKKGKALFLNLIRCEAHNDLSKEILKKYLER